MVVMGTREGAVDAGEVLWTRRPKVLRHSEGCASTPWNSLFMGRAASSVDAGDPNSPSFRGHAVAVESPIEGHTPNRGRGRVVSFSVILAQRGSPGQGQRSTSPWTRELKLSVIQRPQAVGSPIEGGAVRCRYLGRTNGGIASSQSPLGSASALRRKLLSLPCSSFSAAIRFAGFASEAWAAERENDSRV